MTELRSSLKLTEGDNQTVLSSGLFLRNASYKQPTDGEISRHQGISPFFQEKFNEGIYISPIVFF
ncbi:hypothetical protein C2C86_08100 [Escherichia coli]|nr:hypothetical protein [Escherichia coli]EFO3597281.1 hypothetical protein [Escherichia coli]EFO3681464.1 hypothetical protein [Escherichia coli]HAI6087452.1 hypothetical protein [Escherichia coli]HAW0679350.1 hypothetical protein [Escherichia coli]